MAAGKYLELAVILRAVDNLSSTVKGALGGATTGYTQLFNSQQKADAAMKKGLSFGAGAKVGIDMLEALSKKYGDLQEEQENLRISMLTPGGGIDEVNYKKFIALGKDLSVTFGDSQAAYINMIRLMRENRLDPKDILGGAGRADAMLSDLFKTAPGEAAVFTARMKNDMRVPSEEIIKLIDLTARLKNVGVGATGSEAIANMTELFSKAGLGATNLGLHGTKDTMELGALGGMYIAKGNDAASVGTTFRRIFDNIADPARMKKMNIEAAKFGKHLEFYDKAGRFLGIHNLVAQLGTLHGMPTSQISEIVGPMGSKQGMSGDVLKNMSEFGREDYGNFMARIANQGDITAKWTEEQKELNQQLRRTGSDVDNLQAIVGKSYNPVVQKAVIWTGELSNFLGKLAEDNPKTASTFSYLTAAAVGVMTFAAAIKFAKVAWYWTDMPALFGTLASAGSTAWGALRMGAYMFADTLSTTVLPMIASVIEAITGITLGAAAAGAGIAAAVATPFALGFYKANEYAKWYKTQNYQQHYVPIDQKVIDSYNKGKVNVTDAQAKINEAKISSLEKIVHSADFTRPGMGKTAAPLKAAPPLKQVINYKPSIVIQGNADKKTIKDMLDTHKAELMRLVGDAHNAHARVAY